MHDDWIQRKYVMWLEVILLKRWYDSHMPNGSPYRQQMNEEARGHAMPVFLSWKSVIVHFL